MLKALMVIFMRLNINCVCVQGESGCIKALMIIFMRLNINCVCTGREWMLKALMVIFTKDMCRNTALM